MALNTARTDGQGKAVFGNQDVNIQSYTTLLRADGTPYPHSTAPAPTSNMDIDPKAIALTADGKSVYIASEGDKNHSANGVVVVNDFVNKHDLATGQQSAELPIPAAYQITDTTDATSGSRNNLAFESVTISGNTLLTGVENRSRRTACVTRRRVGRSRACLRSI